MGMNLFLGIFIFAACFAPTCILLAYALRSIKEEQQEIIKLKRNPMSVLFSFLLNGLTFGLSVSAFIYIITSTHLPIWIHLFTFPFMFLASIDFIILISHVVNEWRYKVTWDKKQNVFNVRHKGSEFQFPLDSDTLQIIHYFPPMQGGPRGFPGFNYHVLVLSDHGNTWKVSSITYDNYDFFQTLSEHPNFTVIKRQFNVLL
jgi:hypothetical protein